ncbi:hypothetical protein [Halobaculum marinum]|uniref:Uncharacterized protein n=1 Tax=Halobaculum marinum TaxID=3031996 RepID=A0ABD5X782_9EURY|nr:hypothetical protein [Halobaculum sp. DT55]
MLSEVEDTQVPRETHVVDPEAAAELDQFDTADDCRIGGGWGVWTRSQRRHPGERAVAVVVVLVG